MTPEIVMLLAGTETAAGATLRRAARVGSRGAEGW